jgi:hypothetical protein
MAISEIVDDTPAAHGMANEGSRGSAASKEQKNSSKTGAVKLRATVLLPG